MKSKKQNPISQIVKSIKDDFDKSSIKKLSKLKLFTANK